MVDLMLFDERTDRMVRGMTGTWFWVKFAIVIFIFVMVFVFILFLGKEVKGVGGEHFKTLLTEAQRVKLLGAMLSLHEVFERRKLWYVISYGTLLGAVRQRGMIPWDDDMDILVKHENLKEVEEALKELEGMGFKTEKTWKLYKVYADDSKELFIDLFVIAPQYDDDQKYMRCYTNHGGCEYNPKSDKWWWSGFSFEKSWVDARKKFELNGLSLWGPSDAWHFLRNYYGDDFLSTCQTPIYDHKTGQYVTPESKPCPNTYPVPQF